MTPVASSTSGARIWKHPTPSASSSAGSHRSCSTRISPSRTRSPSVSATCPRITGATASFFDASPTAPTHARGRLRAAAIPGTHRHLMSDWQPHRLAPGRGRPSMPSRRGWRRSVRSALGRPGPRSVTLDELDAVLDASHGAHGARPRRGARPARRHRPGAPDAPPRGPLLRRLPGVDLGPLPQRLGPGGLRHRPRGVPLRPGGRAASAPSRTRRARWRWSVAISSPGAMCWNASPRRGPGQAERGHAGPASSSSARAGAT